MKVPNEVEMVCKLRYLRSSLSRVVLCFSTELVAVRKATTERLLYINDRDCKSWRLHHPFPCIVNCKKSIDISINSTGKEG